MRVFDIEKSNWTGEKVHVSICEETKAFNYADYDFTLEGYTESDPTEKAFMHGSWVTLYGSEWNRDPLVTLHFDGHGISLETQLRKAVSWIANHV